MSRWVCLRCFEANDDGVAACQSCGLLRGASPSAGEGPLALGNGAPTPAPRRSPLLLLLRFWWIALLVVVPVAGVIINAQRGDDGQLTKGGTLAVGELRVGDCFDLADETAESVQEVKAHPCAEAHHYEVFHVGTMSGISYPTEDAIGSWLVDECLPAFTDYVGRPYETSVLEISWFQPTQDGWGQGDRSVQCSLYDPQQPVRNATARGSAL